MCKAAPSPAVQAIEGAGIHNDMVERGSYNAMMDRVFKCRPTDGLD